MSFGQAAKLPTEIVERIRVCRLKSDSYRTLNAFITSLWDEAEQHGASCSTNNEQEVHPLYGKLLAVKDNFCTTGVKASCNSLMLENYKPPYTATVVERLQHAGMIVVGKTNMDSFGMGSGSIDGIHGPVINPWTFVSQAIQNGESIENLTGKAPNDEFTDFHIAGGSSGGSAVAVALGIADGALGSDTGGSVRLPASYCGVIGLKPTTGLVSRYGLITLVNSLDCPGVMSQDLDTCVQMFNAMAGHDVNDSTTQYNKPFHPVELSEEPRVKNLRVGVPQEFLTDLTTDEVKNLWSEVVDKFEQAGANVIPVNLPHIQHSICCYSVINCGEVASNMARFDGIEFGYRGSDESSTENLFADTRHAAFSDVVRGRMFAGNYFNLKKSYSEYPEKAARVRRLIHQDFVKAFNDVDILVAPISQSAAPLASDFTQLDNRTQSAIQDALTQPINLAGVPSISLPLSKSSAGLPLSMQLISKWFDEKSLLNTSKWLTSQFNFTPLSKILS